MSAESEQTTTEAQTHRPPESLADFDRTAGGGAPDALLVQLLAHLNSLAGITVSEVDAHACGALGCSRSECPLWRVDVDQGRRRTLCPTHAVDFTRKESSHDV